MTWQAIGLAAVLGALCVGFAFLVGGWLALMQQRTRGVWPLLAVIAMAFVFAVGLAVLATQLDIS